MCVIAAKPAGIDMPSDEIIENMWKRNSDGAGFMYAQGGQVHIEKGFMTLDRFKQKLKEIDKKYSLKKLSVVMHFRITTHGGTKPENTHPFPISDSLSMLKKRRVTTDLGVAHNGMIDIATPKDISDTMQYIASELAPLKRAMPEFYRNKDMMLMIEHRTDSKLAFLDKKGRIETVGNFIEQDGVKYSNRTFENYYGYRGYSWSEWDGYNDYGNWNYANNEYRMASMKLMWLDEDRGEYVKDCVNNKIIDGEFAIDAGGNLYEYNPGIDCFEEVYTAAYQAYGPEGLPLRYNAKSKWATEELVLL